MEDVNEFRQAMAFTLKWEGGITEDSGGITKWGISQKAYPNLDIVNLTPLQACQIYVQDYWDAMGCDDIPFPFNAAVFDTAVNCGVARAKDWFRNSNDVNEFLEKRKQYYIDLAKSPKYQPYLKGWLNRTQDLQKFVVTSYSA